MFDFFDGEILRVGNILGRDTLKREERKADGEEGMHGAGVGDEDQAQGTQAISKMVTLQK